MHCLYEVKMTDSSLFQKIGLTTQKVEARYKDSITLWHTLYKYIDFRYILVSRIDFPAYLSTTDLKY